MAFGRPKKDKQDDKPATPTGTLPTSMPTRLPASDPRTAGYETTYQASRGGWFKPNNRR